MKKKYRYIVEDLWDNTEVYRFRRKKDALSFAYEMSRYYGLVVRMIRIPSYKYGQGKIFVYANGTYRRF